MQLYNVYTVGSHRLRARTQTETHLCSQTLIHWDACSLAPPSLSPGPSPGVGPVDGLGALVTGFTRATASLGTCPHPKESAQGVTSGPRGGGQQQGHGF